jgi:sugar transferase (PEP-CTERM/EpsH1 system associated)
MEEMLFLTHRLPYPPDKGDKIRSWHLLRHFAATRRVHLGCFVDDPADRAHIEMLRSLCAETWIGDLSPTRARARSLTGFATGSPLTFPYFWSPRLAQWVARVRAERPLAQGYVFSSCMAQYVHARGEALRRLPLEIVDLVDLDSEKWRQYARAASAPMRWIFRREAERMAAAEAAIARRSHLTLLVSDAEAEDFRRRSGVPREKVHVHSNGVDTGIFDPDRTYPRVCEDAAGPLIVFTGAMDYRANVDAVTWFAREVLPLVHARRAEMRFAVIGARPSTEVLALAKLPGVTVTGRISDVRPWLAQATVVVAPLRLARGIQNKVLEAMAMARAVVCSPQALTGIRAEPGVHVLIARSAQQFSDAVLLCADDEALRRRLALAARALVERSYRWETRLDEMEELVSAAQSIARSRRMALA